jgi:hypothetical protein
MRKIFLLHELMWIFFIWLVQAETGALLIGLSPTPPLCRPLSLSLSLGSASVRLCVRARTPHGVDAHRRPNNVAKELHVSIRPDW